MLPVRKISPTKVAITSNYGKLFMSRSERKTADPYKHVVDFIKNDYLNEGGVVKKIVPGKKSLNKIKVPNIYTQLASEFNEVVTEEFVLHLKPADVGNYIKEEVSLAIEKKDAVYCGYLKGGDILVVDYNDVFYNYSKIMTPLGSIEDMLGLDQDKIPKPFSTLKVLGDEIALGVILSYHIGISGLLAYTGCDYQILGPRQQYKPTRDELVLRFEDHKLIVKTNTTASKLLFNGFLFYKDVTKRYPLSSFDSKDIYLTVLEHRRSGLIHLKELSSLEARFIDPITRDVLEETNMPTEYLKVLIYANNLLDDFQHPDINDPNYSRIRGYDRVPGLMYRALAESVREFKLKGRAGSKISLDPFKVWNYVTQDSTVKATEDLNPILNCKENEALTFTGLDGLSKDATPKELRRFHPNEAGLTSEATVDSADVALNIYLSPYAKISSVRGKVDTTNEDIKDTPAFMFSSPALIAPVVEQDDPKRGNYTSIQYSHSIPSAGYRQPTMRTEQEYVMPYRVSSLYAVMAEQAGVVKDLTDKVITVAYTDGTVKGYRIGKRYGKMEGSIYSHNLITELKKGSKFSEGDAIIYNDGFFERDWLPPHALILKHNRDCTTAFAINAETYEDSSVLSREFSKTMETEYIKEKNFIIPFEVNLIGLVPVDTDVNPDTILFTGIDDVGDFSNLSESTIAMLQTQAALSPKAKVNGAIDRYEIKYNGDLSDMSPSIRKLAKQLDNDIYESTKNTDHEVTNNRVNTEYRSEGKNLNLNTLELKVYIRVKLNMEDGDKGVFGNNAKSVTAAPFVSNIRTESGDKVHGMYSYKGVINRIINSPIIIGATNRTVRLFGKQVVDDYFN